MGGCSKATRVICSKNKRELVVQGVAQHLCASWYHGKLKWEDAMELADNPINIVADEDYDGPGEGNEALAAGGAEAEAEADQGEEDKDKEAGAGAAGAGAAEPEPPSSASRGSRAIQAIGAGGDKREMIRLPAPPVPMALAMKSSGGGGGIMVSIDESRRKRSRSPPRQPDVVLRVSEVQQVGCHRNLKTLCQDAILISICALVSFPLQVFDSLDRAITATEHAANISRSAAKAFDDQARSYVLLRSPCRSPVDSYVVVVYASLVVFASLVRVLCLLPPSFCCFGSSLLLPPHLSLPSMS